MAPFLQYLLTASTAILSAFDTSHSVSKPSILLDITPIFNESHHATSLVSSLVLKYVPDIETGNVLLEMTTLQDNAPSNDYSGEHSLHASDENGVLPTYFEDDTKSNMRYWYSNRTTKGSITVMFEAFPTILDKHTPVGARVDLRADQGGLLGTGLSFIPVPPKSATIYDIKLVWNLAHARSGTLTVWTFGDGPQASKSGTAEILTGSNFMVGPINSYRHKVRTSIGVEEDFGVYWFGTPPTFDITDIVEKCEKLFTVLAGFFLDTDVSYKIFLRFNPVKGFGGTGMLRSFVLEYDLITKPTAESILYLLTHEMIHNWPLMSAKDGEAIARELFYDEGVANFYTLMLPLRFGITSKEEFLKAINAEASAYYTNPQINLSNTEASRLFWQDFEAGRTQYNRGCMYLFSLNSQIIKASKGARSLDNSVLELLRRKNEGEEYALEDWLALLVEELGEQAMEGYNAMARGETIVPSADMLGDEFKLVREDQHVYELGFDQKSVSARLVSGVIAGTRAAEADLRDGDVIIESPSLWEAADDYALNLTLLIERDGEKMAISFWPRGWNKVETWQWILSDNTVEITRLELR